MGRTPEGEERLEVLRCKCGSERHRFYAAPSGRYVFGICDECRSPVLEVQLPIIGYAAKIASEDRRCASCDRKIDPGYVCDDEKRRCAICHAYWTAPRQRAPSHADGDKAMGSARHEPADVGEASKGGTVMRKTFTLEQRQQILADYLGGEPLKSIASRYGCNQSYPAHLKRRYANDVGRTPGKRGRPATGRNEPWKAQGISMATYYNRRKMKG